MSKYINPLDIIKSEKASQGQSQSSSSQMQSESMMMDDGTVCPKCNIQMKQCKLAGGAAALHCSKCRTTGPIPE